MTALQNLIRKLPGGLQTIALRAMYRVRGNRKLGQIKRYKNASFFIYEIDKLFIPSQTINWYVSYDHYYNWVDTISAWAYKPKSGDVVIDIGAGIGEEALVFSKMVGENGKVIAIEANPEVFNVLQNVVSLNKLKNVLLADVAISTTNEPVKLSVSSESFVGGTIDSTNKEDETYEVQGVRLDNFLDNKRVEKIDLLKVNIEGAERFVIESIGERIKIVRHIAISCHDFRFKKEGNEFFKTKKLVTDYLTVNGFDVSHQHTNIDYVDDWVYGFNKRNFLV